MNIGILIEPFRQRDGWTATLMTLVMHGSSPRFAAHDRITPLK